MEAKVESLSDNRVKVTVTVDSKEVSKAIKASYKQVAAKYNFPGFRKGKAPRPVIDSAFGADYVSVNVTEDLMGKYYPQAIDELRIFPTGKPEFAEDNALAEDGKDLVIVFEVEVKAEVKLLDYDMVEIELPEATVSDEEVDEQLTGLSSHYFTYEPAIPSHKTEDGDRLTLKQTLTVDSGREIDTVSGDSFVYTLGSGLLPADYEEKLKGCKNGAKKTFTIDMPKEAPAYLKELQDLTKKLNFDVEIVSVSSKVLPLIDDVFAKEQMGFENLAELKTQIRESLVKQKNDFIPRLKERLCTEALVKKLKDEVPAGMVEEREADLMQDFFKQLQASGMTFDSYLKDENITAEQFKEEIKKQAADVAAEDMALDAWASHYKLEATDEEVYAEFETADPEHAKDLFKEWKESGRLYLVREGVTRSKAVNDLMDRAKVTAYAIGEKVAKAEKKTTKKAAAKKDDAKKETKKEPAKKTAAKKADGDKKPAKKATKKAAKAE